MEKLRMYRKENGITQSELAARIGVSQSKLSKFETGAMVPDVTEAFTIEKVTDRVVRACMWAGGGATNESTHTSAQIRRGVGY
ncbi:helix-turn-helix transcriptional regulator [uncultured Pelagimonas sp.]|uniref:helix-turn-helix domain-containing protein n=1 Tax=uncultured Pelagimonas sp. TaxID=1618102 RepID=UPI00262757E6|nr:helix-turn-helix transcriptional regulator [uncultured Pelagimonas sp.]